MIIASLWTFCRLSSFFRTSFCDVCLLRSASDGRQTVDVISGCDWHMVLMNWLRRASLCLLPCFDWQLYLLSISSHSPWSRDCLRHHAALQCHAVLTSFVFDADVKLTLGWICALVCVWTQVWVFCLGEKTHKKVQLRTPPQVNPSEIKRRFRTSSHENGVSKICLWLFWWWRTYIKSRVVLIQIVGK